MTTKELDKEFSRQTFDNSSQSMLDHCKMLAAMYAETENVIKETSGQQFNRCLHTGKKDATDITPFHEPSRGIIFYPYVLY